MFGGNNKMKEHLEPLTIERHFDFFVSHKWNNKISDEETKRICEQLVLYQINPIVDKYNLKYGESIVAFMDGIKKCNGVILLICNDYFFSINCMYEGITAMKDCKNKTIIRIVESSIFSNDFKGSVAKFWDECDETKMLGEEDKQKLKKVRDNYQEFVFWISDTHVVKTNDILQFEKELNKHIEKVFLEGSNYYDMVEDLNSSKKVAISKVCDPVGEEYYYYKNINYLIQDSPVDYFKCIYNFTLSLEKYDTKERMDIYINNVVGIDKGNYGENFSKYYFVIPKQNSLDNLAFEEKLGKEKSVIEYDERRIVIYF